MKNKHSFKIADTYRFFLCQFSILFLFTQFCYTNKDRISDADFLIKDGQFVSALQEFYSLHKEYPKDPNVLKNLGMLLSISPSSFLVASHFIQQSLQEKFDNDLLRQLFILYVQMNSQERILTTVEDIIREKGLSKEQKSKAHIEHIRIAVACLQEKESLNTIKNLLNKLEKKDEKFPFYTFLCNLSLKSIDKNNKKKQQLPFLWESYYKIKEAKIRCEAQSIWLSQLQTFSSNAISQENQIEKELCLQKFPSLLSMYREFSHPKENLNQTSNFAKRAFPTIFLSDPFLFSDPGPEGIKPPRYINEDNITSDSGDENNNDSSSLKKLDEDSSNKNLFLE